MDEGLSSEKRISKKKLLYKQQIVKELQMICRRENAGKKINFLKLYYRIHQEIFPIDKKIFINILCDFVEMGYISFIKENNEKREVGEYSPSINDYRTGDFDIEWILIGGGTE